MDKSRLPRLLNMAYTPRELAEELACSIRQVRAALDAGAPHSRNEKGHLAINGRQFADWLHREPPHTKLQPNEAYCFKCRSAVPFTAVTTTATNGNSELAKGVCPQCGTTICRARRREQ